MNFTLTKIKPNRAGIYKVRNKSFKTPVFAPDATKASIKYLTPRDFTEIGLELILSNTYHLMIRPGEDIIKHAGGLNKFINYYGVILTDSGGFQVYSLRKLGKITDDGVEFSSHIDGKKFYLTPESSIEIQYRLGSDIIMVLDQCIPNPSSKEYAQKAIDRTYLWAQRSKKRFEELTRDDPNPPHLWGIVQGSIYSDLREESAKQLVDLDMSGYAIGGLAVGESAEEMYKILDITVPLLPKNKPRYLMGVGTPENINESVKRGIDVFDSVMPTRNARHGYLFTSQGVIRIKKSDYTNDLTALDANCACYACKGGFTKSYLRHLYNINEPLAQHLGSIHNLTYYKTLMESFR